MKIICLRIISLFALMVMILSTLEMCIFMYMGTLNAELFTCYTSLWAGLTSVGLAAAIVYLHVAHGRLSSIHGFTLFGTIATLQAVAWCVSEFVEWNQVVISASDGVSSLAPLYRIHWYTSVLYSLSVTCAFSGFEFALIVCLMWMPKRLTIPKMFAVNNLYNCRLPSMLPLDNDSSSDIKSLNFSGHLASTPKDQCRKEYKHYRPVSQTPFCEQFAGCTPYLKGHRANNIRQQLSPPGQRPAYGQTNAFTHAVTSLFSGEPRRMRDHPIRNLDLKRPQDLQDCIRVTHF